jgi:hypothetical protein
MLRMRNVSDKYCRESSNTHFMLENPAAYEIMWKYMVEPDGPQVTIQHGAEKMLFACSTI